MRLILVSRQRHVHSVRRLVTEALHRGLDCEISAPEELPPLQGSDTLWPRLDLRNHQKTLELLSPFEGKCRFINSPSALARARDKWAMALLFHERGLPHPTTALVPDWNRATTWIRKPRFGSQGFGIEILKGPRSEQVFAQDGDRFVYQELIRIEPDGDVRLLMDRQGLVGAMSRRPRPGEWRSNLSCGGRPRPMTPSRALVDLADQARRLAGLDIAGVDLLKGRHGWVVLEVNGSPGLAGLEATRNENITASLIRRAFP